MENQNKNQIKAERFKKLASQRTNNVLKTLKVLGNCANRSLYDYSDDDARRIFKAIKDKLEETELRFKYRDKEFKL